MNFIPNNKIWVVIILFSIIQYNSYTRSNDSSYYVSVETIAGYSTTLNSSFLDGKLYPALRLFWEPDHLLSIGLETSIINIQKIETEEKEFGASKSKLKASLNALPVLLLFNMEIWKINITAGMGVSYIWTDAEAFGTKIISDDWNYSITYGLGYTYMFNNFWGIGLETRAYLFTKLDKKVASLNFKLKYSFLYW